MNRQFLNQSFYLLRPIIPRMVQLTFRRQFIKYKRRLNSHIWPIDARAGQPPPCWHGWPENKQFALVLQHDVETQKGQENCYLLLALEEKMGFRSSFFFVPERYNVSPTLRHDLLKKGFETGTHGLKHDGRLFQSENIFRSRAQRINRYLKDWQSTGFSSPSMHHRFEWMRYLNITHATTTFDSDPFEPMSDGVRTIFPFVVGRSLKSDGYVELPYTLPQDHTLFIIMKEKDIRIWKQKLDWIAARGGMALLNTHPDYMLFNGPKFKNEEYPAEYYQQFLQYVQSKYQDLYWPALPSQVAAFWRERMAHGKGQRAESEAKVKGPRKKDKG